MNNFVNKRVLDVMVIDHSWPGTTNSLKMGTVTGTSNDSDDSDEEENDNTRYNVTWDDYGYGKGDPECWSSHKVRTGIDLYETSIALWEPNRSNYLNERVALDVYIGINQEIVFGRVSGQLEDLWTIECDQINRQHDPLCDGLVKEGIQRFQELKEFSKEEYKLIRLSGRNR